MSVGRKFSPLSVLPPQKGGNYFPVRVISLGNVSIHANFIFVILSVILLM